MDKKFSRECTYCESRFEFEEKDLDTSYHWEYDTLSDIKSEWDSRGIFRLSELFEWIEYSDVFLEELQVKCPVCKEEIVLWYKIHQKKNARWVKQ